MVRSGDLLGHVGESAVSWRAAWRECRPDNIRAVRFRRWCVRRRGQTSKARVRKESRDVLIGGRNDACRGGGQGCMCLRPSCKPQRHCRALSISAIPVLTLLGDASQWPSQASSALKPPSHLHLMNQLLSVHPPLLCKSSRRCTPQLPRAAGHLLRHASPTSI